MHIIAVSAAIPQPNQASADQRFFTLLSLLARKHTLFISAMNADGTTQPCNDDDTQLEQADITLNEINLTHVFKTSNPILSGSDAKIGTTYSRTNLPGFFKNFNFDRTSVNFHKTPLF